MRIHNFISVIFHPIVVPTVGVFLYFLFIPLSFYQEQKTAVLGLVFAITYLIPLCILFLLKSIKIIHSFKVFSIRERKVPIGVMIFLFYVLGNKFQIMSMNNGSNFLDLAILFYGTALGLFLLYILFFFKIKTSVHLLSMGISTSFFLLLNYGYSFNFLWVVIICVICSGIVASARLHLNAHTRSEVYLGYLLGFFSPILVYYFL